jgi:hypothetical protein
MVRENHGMVAGMFIRKKTGTTPILLDGAHELHRFMTLWDIYLMRHGIGASFFPVAALEFIDALVFEENRRDVLSIRPITKDPAGFSLDLEDEWKPTTRLRELIAEYLENAAAHKNTTTAAASLLRFMEDSEDRVFDVPEWGNHWLSQVLKEACRTGREIPSANGTWREILSSGAMAAAVRALSYRAKNSAEASAAMSLHMGSFTYRYQLGGCDLYLLWDNDGHPAAIAAVGADGEHVTMTPPSHDRQLERTADVNALVDALGTASDGRKSYRPDTPGGV